MCDNEGENCEVMQWKFCHDIFGEKRGKSERGSMISDEGVESYLKDCKDLRKKL